MIFHDIDQNSDEWSIKRSIMPTASNFSKIITSKGDLSKSLDGYAETLANNKFAGTNVDSWDGNKFTERGHEIEPLARKWYEDTYFCDISNGGFVTDDNETFGASPDGFISAKKLIEIKCLPKAHTEMLRYYYKNKKIPPKFVAQTQGQLLVCEAETVDLLFYHPLLPKLVITVHRDEKFIGTLRTFIKETCIIRDNILIVLKLFASD